MADKILTVGIPAYKAENHICDALPDWVRELDIKSGVLGEEGYAYTVNEK